MNLHNRRPRSPSPRASTEEPPRLADDPRLDDETDFDEDTDEDYALFDQELLRDVLGEISDEGAVGGPVS